MFHDMFHDIFISFTVNLMSGHMFHDMFVFDYVNVVLCPPHRVHFWREGALVLNSKYKKRKASSGRLGDIKQGAERPRARHWG
jgi:hypothetical protein